MRKVRIKIELRVQENYFEMDNDEKKAYLVSVLVRSIKERKNKMSAILAAVHFSGLDSEDQREIAIIMKKLKYEV